MFRDIVPFGIRSQSAPRSGHPVDAFRREFDRMFDDFWGGWNAPAASGGKDFFAAKVDVKEDEKSITVSTELPGLEEKDVEVTLNDGVLTIRGEKKFEREEKDEKSRYHLTERSYGSFQRAFHVGDDIDEKKVDATFKNGVLTVALPKAAKKAEKAKRIAIKGA